MEENEIVEETQKEAQEEIQEETQEIVKSEVAEEHKEISESTQKKGVQARIDELTWKRREEERKRQEAEQEREYWKQLALGKGETKADGRPQQENYETVEEYEDALYDWRFAKEQLKNLAILQQTEMRKAISEFNKKAALLKETYKDFDQVVEAPVFLDPLRKVLFNIENGPMVAYHIAKNKDLAMRLNSLPPESQAYEVGKLEIQLLLAQKNKGTQAPEPITPVGATGTFKKDPSKMTIEEWMAWNKQHELERIKNKLGR